VAASKSTEREAREARERLRRFTARQKVHENQISRRRRDNLLAVGAVVVIAALAAVTQIFYFNGGPGTPTPAPSASETAAPAAQNVGDVPDPSFAGNTSHDGTLTLNAVALGITLDGAAAPQAVSSLLADSLTGYYVGKTCHRLLVAGSGVLIQCGSLDGTGASDPSYSFGPVENAPADGVYPAGTIAMARASDNAYSNGRQFFIVVSDTTLPADSAGGYTVVGQVTSGLDNLMGTITNAGTVDGSTDGAPLVATTITGFTIE
jgi:peptidyl-prolyl cis-trans isomerase B (cyclophilin B)